MRVHFQIPSQNRVVATIGDVPGTRPIRETRQQRADHRCPGPTFRSARKGSPTYRLKGKATSVASGNQRVQRLFLLGMLMFWPSSTDAHEFITTKITWAREISRVFSRRCVSCHRNGGPAFDLGGYEQARPWAEAIKQEVLERRMPPWGAIKGFGDFRDEDGLTEMEIAVISSWVEGGAPRGDLTRLPKQIKATTERAALPKTGETLVVSGSLTLERGIKVAAVRPEVVSERASLRLIAERPNGGVEPLLWLYGYASRFRRIYYFKAPMSFSAGTRIRIQPGIGSVSLLLIGDE